MKINNNERKAAPQGIRRDSSYTSPNGILSVIIESFNNDASLLYFLTGSHGEEFKSIKDHIDFSIEITRAFQNKDRENRNIFGDWNVKALFHLLKSFFNVVVAMRGMVKIGIDATGDQRSSEYDYLVCLMPANLFLVSQRQRFICSGTNRNCRKWKNTRFFTFDQLCDYFQQNTNDTWSNAQLRQSLSNLFYNKFIQSIYQCFDREINHHNLDSFLNRHPPNYDNITLAPDFLTAIEHSVQCDGKECQRCIKVNDRKRKVFEDINRRLNFNGNGKLMCEYIKYTVGYHTFDARYQIFAKKEKNNRNGGISKLMAEIVLFCNLCGNIVGVPIKLIRSNNEMKWKISTILVSQMKHNTMLPRLLIETTTNKYNQQLQYKLSFFRFVVKMVA